MDAAELIKAILALLFVLSLIMAVAWGVRRFGIDKNWRLKKGHHQRLEVIERLIIDPKRQLILVKRDNREHLLALGQNEVHVVESYDAETQK